MEREHALREPSLFAKYPILTGIVVGLVTLVPHAFLTPEASAAFAAVVIALIAGIYFGFAVMNGSPRDVLVEFTVTGVFTTLGLLGLLRWPVLLPIAYFCHALWDFAHHNRSKLSLVAIPNWYVPWCVIIDVIVAVGLFWIWNSKGLI